MTKPRASHLGWLAQSLLESGPKNGFTDVEGVLVGHSTLIQGEPGPLEIGRGPVRTGVTAVLPHGGNIFIDRVSAGVHVLNGYGKTIGLEQIRELGTMETPILLTNTLNVWRCADALVDWMLLNNPGVGVKTGTINPIVGECNDGWLNDIQGRHVNREHVFTALGSAQDSPVPEGCVGAGTGTQCYQFKGGIGTSSRVLPFDNGGFSVGVLLQTNFGIRDQLIICGLPVGKRLKNWHEPSPKATIEERDGNFEEDGSCMVVLATDAPLNARQLGRLVRRVPLGLARTGFTCNPGSGDYVIGFSTTNCHPMTPSEIKRSVNRPVDEDMTFQLLIQGAIEATEEAVLNALLAANSMEGRDGHLAPAIPVDIIQAWLGQDIVNRPGENFI